MKPPPWIHTNTGAASFDDGGVHTLRVRQSSPVAWPRSMSLVGVLDASRAGAGGIAQPGPGLHGRWRLPSQRPDRRCGVRNSGEKAVVGGGDAAHQAGRRSHHPGICRPGVRRVSAAAAASDGQQYAQHDCQHAHGERQQAVKRSRAAQL